MSGPRAESWVAPSGDHVSFVASEVLQGRFFASLTHVQAAIFFEFGVLIDLKRYSKTLATLLSADSRIWVTPRLPGIEGRPRAVVSRPQFSDIEAVVSWLRSVLGPLGSSRDRGRVAERYFAAHLKAALASRGYRVTLRPSRFHKLSNDIEVTGPGVMANVEIRQRRGVLTSRLLPRDREAWSRDARIGITTIVIATAVTVGFRAELRRINPNSIVIETGAYLVRYAESVEPVSALTRATVTTPTEGIEGGWLSEVLSTLAPDAEPIAVQEVPKVPRARQRPSSALSREATGEVARRVPDAGREAGRIVRHHRLEKRVEFGDRCHAAGMTSEEAAASLGISTRTLRRAYTEVQRSFPWRWGDPSRFAAPIAGIVNY